jgi:hypothetical protein
MQETYEFLIDLMKKQKDYFSHKSPSDIVKLLIYIWSYKRTNDFQLGDDIMNDISFAVVFETQGENYIKTCEHCDGYGENSCDVCDGTGTIQCDECDGDGRVPCDECDGDGRQMGNGEWENCEYCDGTGRESCNGCGGNGDITCDNCGGGGKEECSDCSGKGDIETDEQEYTKYFIMTWNKYIKQRCELTENDSDITMSEYEFDKLRNKYVKLFMSQEHTEFADFVRPNEVYCAMYDDSPKMILNYDMRLQPHNYNINSFSK